MGGDANNGDIRGWEGLEYSKVITSRWESYGVVEATAATPNHWPTFGESASLVERGVGNVRQALEGGGALDNHTALRRAGEGARGGDGRRQNQRARAGGDQHDERLAEPLVVDLCGRRVGQ